MPGSYKLIRDISGSVLVETTLVIPLMLVLVLGIVDVTYMFYEWGLANKAAYRGARTAVVSNPVVSDVTNVSFTATELQNLGQLCFGATTGNPTGNCPTAGSTCTPNSSSGGSCTNSYTFDNNAFVAILGNMRAIFPRLQRQDVLISYNTNGLGFVGQAYTGDTTQYALPMNVTVSITGMTHQFFFVPSILSFFGQTIQTAPNIPRFSSTMQSEDMFTNDCSPCS